jgi:hypothetical protein
MNVHSSMAVMKFDRLVKSFGQPRERDWPEPEAELLSN